MLLTNLLRMLMQIKSSIRNYNVSFTNQIVFTEDFFFIDRNVYNLHKKMFSDLNPQKIVFIDAYENNKSYSQCEKYINDVISLGVKRGNNIAAIGGGITQDIVGFISSILYRGLSWNFYPTTLLAQCDSCIGGKTSINLGSFKNTVGNFNPPNKIFINLSFLSTLSNQDVQSGIGEIIKVCFIDKEKTINDLSLVEAIEQNSVTKDLIQKSLNIKKKIIEIDEFDKNVRNIMNYGHTFGHAIESVTNFEIPHGISVGIGIHIANQISKKIFGSENIKKLDPVMKKFIEINEKHFLAFKEYLVLDRYIEALKKDKKNVDLTSITCILTKGQGKMFKKAIKIDVLRNILNEVLEV